MVRVLSRGDAEQPVDMSGALDAVRAAFTAVDQGRAVMPRPLELRLPDADGELHVKGACLAGAPVFAIKTASGFYRNPGLGLPVSNGMTRPAIGQRRSRCGGIARAVAGATRSRPPAGGS